MTTKKVIFVCTGNSARSQLAEALFRNIVGDSYQVCSAGTEPCDIDPRVFTVLENRHIPATNLSSKPLSSFAAEQFDVAIVLCDKAQQTCADQVNANKILHWDFADPKTKEGLKAFDVVLNELNDRINMFLMFDKKER
jgi:protein-tyrosine-phosphatase